MSLNGTTDTEETVVDPTPLSAPATEAEIGAEHGLSVTVPAAVNAANIGVPADIKINLSNITNKVEVNGVSSESVSYDPISSSDELSNATLNQTAETLKISVNQKLTTLATSITASFSKVGTDMGSQVAEINSKITDFKNAVEQSFAALKVVEGTQNDNIASEINRVAGVLLQDIKAVAEGVADSQSKIAALDDIYQSDSEVASRIAEVNEMISTLRGSDLSALEAMDGVIDEVNNLSRVQQKEVKMEVATGRYSYNLPLENGITFADENQYVITANVVGNPQAVVFIENKTGDSFEMLVKSYGKHFIPQPVDGSVTPVELALCLSYSPSAKLSYIVPTLQEDLSGTDNVTVGEEVTPPAE